MRCKGHKLRHWGNLHEASMRDVRGDDRAQDCDIERTGMHTGLDHATLRVAMVGGPRLHHLPQNGELARVVRVVVGGEQQFA